MDEMALSMPRAMPSLNDESANRNLYQRRRPSDQSRDRERDRPNQDYLPTAIEAPDPNQPLYEALDRIRVVERPAEVEYLKAIKAVKAYEQTERTVRIVPTTTIIRADPPPPT
jgi:hypothetical protein